MKISGIIVCKNCGKSLNWEHVFLQNYSSTRIFDVETFDSNIHQTKMIKEAEKKCTLQLICKNCEEYNSFEIDKL